MREYFAGYLKPQWALVLVLLLTFWFVPSVLVMAGGVVWAITKTTFGAGSEVVSGVYHAGHGVVTGRTDPGPVSHGRESIAEVTVAFNVNHEYHRWGQLTRGFYQLPEITGRVYAARIVNGQTESLLPSDTSLLAQRRRNWDLARPAAPDEQRSRLCPERTDENGRLWRAATCMEWTDVRVVVGADSTHLCVAFWEATQGYNIFGTIDDGLHLFHWNDSHLTSGDVPVTNGSCTPLNANHFPADFPWTSMRRPGEDIPTGSLAVLWEGPNG
jgi:hypothetical protein